MRKAEVAHPRQPLLPLVGDVPDVFVVRTWIAEAEAPKQDTLDPVGSTSPSRPFLRKESGLDRGVHHVWVEYRHGNEMLLEDLARDTSELMPLRIKVQSRLLVPHVEAVASLFKNDVPLLLAPAPGDLSLFERERRWKGKIHTNRIGGNLFPETTRRDFGHHTLHGQSQTYPIAGPAWSSNHTDPTPPAHFLQPVYFPYMKTPLRPAVWLSAVSLIVLGFGCSSSGATTARTTYPSTSSGSSTTTTVTTTTETGSWIPNTKGPWDGSINAATSTDGMTFTGKTLVIDAAGVPNLLLLADGTLVLTYQYFSSTDQTMFDQIAYSTSTDNGKTWTDPAAVNITSLPTPIDTNKKPMDPTLVQLTDGSLRLYFTYHAKGNKTAALYEATAADGKIGSAFVASATPSLIVEKNLLDPAVVYFNGAWHQYSWQDGSDANYHSTSTDGVTFTLQNDVTLPMDFLGQVVPMNNGLRFYGTGKGGVVSAFSTDGSTWTMDTGNRITQGADPGVTQLADGSYLMIYTSMNFNQ